MILVEFFGGPGSGKTTATAEAYAHFKRSPLFVSYSTEYAQRLINEGTPWVLQYQWIVSALQYKSYKEFERLGAQVLFSDSSLLLGKLYNQNFNYEPNFNTIIDETYKEFNTIKVFVKREKKYKAFARLQNEDDAKALDDRIHQMFAPFDIEIAGTIEGTKELITFLENKFKNLIEQVA